MTWSEAVLVAQSLRRTGFMPIQRQTEQLDRKSYKAKWKRERRQRLGQVKVYKARPELKGLDAKAYHAAHMKLWRQEKARP